MSRRENTEHSRTYWYVRGGEGGRPAPFTPPTLRTENHSESVVYELYDSSKAETDKEKET